MYKISVAAIDKEIIRDIREFSLDFGYKVVSTTSYSSDFLIDVELYKPDILIIESVLYDFTVTALHKRLTESNLIKNCRLILITRNPNMIPSCNFDSIMLYPFSNFDLNDTLTSLMNKAPVSFDRRITRLLHKVGMSSSLSGYNCLQQALTLIQRDKTLLNNLSGRLYPNIASSNSCSVAYVDRLIRTAIEASWKNCPPEVVDDIFGNSVSALSGCPSNAQFIATLSEYLFEQADL